MSEAKNWADLGPGPVRLDSPPRKPAPQAVTVMSERERLNHEARQREIASQPPPAKETGWVKLDGLEDLVDRRKRTVKEREAVDREAVKDRREFEAKQKEFSGAAVAALVDGKAADFSPEAKARREFETREASRAHRLEAITAAEQAIEASIRTSLAASVRTLYAGMREHEARLVREQVACANQLLALLEEGHEMQRRALGEIGRVRRVLPDLKLGPEYEETPGEQITGTDGRGTRVLLGTSPTTRRQLDSPDLKILRRFLEDAFIGVPSFTTSKRAAIVPRLRDFLTAARDEGHHV